MNPRHAIAAVLLAGLFLQSAIARAAESYDNCNNFIDSLPATISTQGVWCLRHDLSTNITSGAAIEITANNVTVDCNDFKLGGLAAGTGTGAVGIHGNDRQNITVRRCNIRGFCGGIVMLLGAGHLVEDNRLDNNLGAGISIGGAGKSLVRHNRVHDTGGGVACYPQYLTIGIAAEGDVIDNTIENVYFAGNEADSYDVYGIYAFARGAQVSGNRVSGVLSKGTVGAAGHAYGIYAVVDQSVAQNRIVTVNGPDTLTYGIYGNGAFCTDNTIAKVDYQALINCQIPDPDNNLVL
jgi:parallel beta-helix repeat protein